MTLFDLPPEIEPGGELQTPVGLLQLMSCPGVGASKAIKLASCFSTWERLRSATPAALNDLVGKGAALGVQTLPSAVDQPLSDGVRLVGYFDRDFPVALKGIPSPPAVLWIRGSLDDLRPGVAIVGTRAPSARGLAATARLAEQAAEKGLVVISGLALGVDAVAHRACLARGGRTIAVLGSGVDVPSPVQHRQLAEAILSTGGALCSEVPLGTSPSPRTLVSRNRLQAGLAKLVVIPQCGVPSGTLHTAGFALAQGRLLAAVEPPDSYAADWAGNEALLHPDGLDRHPAAPAVPAALLRSAPKGRAAAATLKEPEDLDRLCEQFT